MFGLFKKKKEINLNNLVDFLISESLWFAAKVEGELPKNYSDNELEDFLVKRIQLWEQGKSLHSSYVKAHKIAFEYVLIMLHTISRHLGKDELSNTVYQKLVNLILKKYIKYFKVIYEGSDSDIELTLMNQINDSENSYSKIKAKDTNDFLERLAFNLASKSYVLMYEVDKNTIDILDEKYLGILRHIATSQTNKKIWLEINFLINTLKSNQKN